MFIIGCALLLPAAPASAGLSAGESASGSPSPRQTFCVAGTTTDLSPPRLQTSLASTFCLEGTKRVEITERFVGDDRTLTGVGFWSIFITGVPVDPVFVITIYDTGEDGCPIGDPLFSHSFSVFEVGPGSGENFADPIEYFADFEANGTGTFFKQMGVEYSISIMNDNCPGEGEFAYWASSDGDMIYGCIDAPDFGFNWSPFSEAGYAFDNAFYLCNVEDTAAEVTAWGTVKAIYR